MPTTTPNRGRLDDELATRAALGALPDPAARRAIRAGAGVSQAAVAEAVGVSANAVAKWETDGDPRGEHLERYAALLTELNGSP